MLKERVKVLGNFFLAEIVLGTLKLEPNLNHSGNVFLCVLPINYSCKFTTTVWQDQERLTNNSDEQRYSVLECRS
jgi:hypothetical protein